LVRAWIFVVLCRSPWYFRKFNTPFVENAALFKGAVLAKTALGIILLLLGVFIH